MSVLMSDWLRTHGRDLLKWLVLDKASLHVVNHGSPLPLGWPFPHSFGGIVPYGATLTRLEVRKLAADRRRVTLEIELEGETRPVTVTLDYRIDRHDRPAVRLFVERVEASRPWFQKLLERGVADFLPDGYRIPSRLLSHGVPEVLDYLDLL
ncbi:hypothetical protein SAMN05444156_0742 [Verrucomicrobium sp. GAS474]|uniref:hypothetical protein n=1 Tax=Verrucomicrobium sp. GAS474 TaxID=1882831 RepID=UPI0008792AB1|nr:hypothetical protein [Verrucomicrobium sp. GAS474]SDT91953.1 hypothetical protein SAMN05444156_0742 [Verrucomicrobium sp. GAS474]